MKNESEIIIDIVGRFLEFISSSEAEWKEAYLRFNGDLESSGITATFLRGDTAHYIEADDDLEFETMSVLIEMFQELQRNLPFKVCLLVVKPNKEYKIKFEQQLIERWRITKANGDTGVPADYKNECWW
ncbi:hypothetical protein [Aquipseudomonas alcaligenes]|uniref:hypothetical protein n=1 Tax=Aquipseudomonas alcaligenes TaxID=43263 RepID=UPI00117A3EC1|nr:hypothetical protein [Pseudomonas alcaligenes]